MDTNIADDVVRAFDGLTNASRATGIPISTIDSWRRTGRIPHWRKSAIRAAADREGIILPDSFVTRDESPA